MDRATMLRLGLPIVERLATTLTLRGLGRVPYRTPGDDADETVAFTAIFGPTRDELAALAPELLRTVDHGSVAGERGAFHAPVRSAADLRPAVQRYWDHVRTYGENAVELNVVALPPGIAVRRAFAKELAGVPGGEAVGTAGSVLFSTLLTGVCVVLGPDDRLAAPELRPLLDWCFEPYLYFYRHGFVTSELIDGLRENREAGEKDWSAVRMPRRPDFVWSLHADAAPADAEAGVVLQLDATTHGATVHFRRLSESAAVALGRDAAAIDRLYDVATGTGRRGDDDRIVPKIEVAAAGKWDAGWADREWAVAADFARSRGYAMRPLGRICAAIGPRPATLSPDEAGRSVWFDDGRPVRDAAVVGDDAVWLLCHDAADAEFVWRSLGEVEVHVACLAMGSLRQPRVSPQLLADVRVPWPEPGQRAALLAGLRRTGLTAAARKEAEQALAQARKWLDRTPTAEWPDVEQRKRTLADLRRHSAKHPADPKWTEAVRNLERTVRDDEESQRYMPEDDNGPRSPWDRGPGELVRLRDSVLRLNAAVGIVGDTPQDTAGAAYPPAPLAILRRRLRNERSPHARLSLLFDLADVTMRYDACLSLALLAGVDPGYTVAVFEKAMRDKYRQSSADLLLSLGHWTAVQQHARRELAGVLSAGRVPVRLRDFAARAAAPPADQVAKAADALVRLRNNAKGHGFTAPPAQAEQDADTVQRGLTDLDTLLPHLADRMLLYVATAERGRRGVNVHYRKLVHDNEAFEVESLSFAAGEAPDFHDGEVYLLANDRDVLLPLHPWLVYRPPAGGGAEALWFFDGLRKDRVVYKSPQVPGDNRLESADDFDDVRDRVRP